MVSFNCNKCGDVVKKPKVKSHSAQCGSGSFTCVDCMVVFNLSSIESHRECVSEVQKYQGKWQDKKKFVSAPAEGAAPRKKFSAADFDDTDMDDDAPVKKTNPLKASGAKLERRGCADDSDSDEPVVATKKAKSKSRSAKASPAHGPAGKKKTASPLSSPKVVPKVAKKPVVDDSDSDDDVPAPKAAAKKASPKASPKAAPKVAKKPVVADSDSDDDVPAPKAKKVSPKAAPKAAKKPVVADSDSDDDVPAPKAKATKVPSRKASPKAAPAAAKKAVVNDSDSDDDVPAPKAAAKKASPKASPKAAPALPKPAGKISVPTFELGPVAEVADMAAAILDSDGVKAMPLKDVARRLTEEVYAKRVQKHVLAALQGAFEGKAALSGFQLDGKTAKRV